VRLRYSFFNKINSVRIVYTREYKSVEESQSNIYYEFLARRDILLVPVAYIMLGACGRRDDDNNDISGVSFLTAMQTLDMPPAVRAL